MPSECVFCRQQTASKKHADFDICGDCELELEAVVDEEVEDEEEGASRLRVDGAGKAARNC